MYKWIILLIIPVLIFIIFIIYLLSPSSESQPVSDINFSPTNSQLQDSSQPEISKSEEQITENELDENIDLRPDLQKKDIKSDGTTTYIFTSNNPSRPNITIVSESKNLIFSRTLNSTDSPMANVSVLIESLGEAERVIQGSKFYGPQADIYIYASLGLVFIGNTQTDESFEEQHFPPMSVDAYLQRFGSQN